MKYHLLSAQIIGIAVLLATASVAAKPKSTSNETTAQTGSKFHKTAAQSEAIIAEDAGEATENSAETAKGSEEYSEELGGILYDKLVKAKSQRALFSKIRSESRPLMDSWLGADECALVDKWGSSGNGFNARTARYLTYVYGYHVPYLTWDGDKNRDIIKTLPDRFFCNVTFELRGGVITDYRFEGNYCSANARGMARGPN